MKTYTRKQLAIVLIALVALLIPTFAPAFHAQAAEKVLRYWSTEQPTLDPQASNFATQAALEYGLFRGLLRYDEKGNVIPSIAQDVPTVANGGVSADGKIVTFKLRDWKWSDGKGTVKAQDFVYSFRRLLDDKLASAYADFLNGIVVNAEEIRGGKAKPDTLGIKAVDDKTVQFSLVKATPYFNSMVALWIFGVVRQDNVERAGLSSPEGWIDPANGEVVSSGPFILKAWDHNKSMTFVKNPNFSGSPAKLDRIEFTLQDDTAVVYAGYKAGELDVSGIPTAEYDNIKADPVLGKELLQYDAACSFYLGMDNTRPPFNNKKVRQAFSYAVDRDRYIKVITRGLATKQLEFLPPSIPPGDDPNLGKDLDFNPDLARKTLAEAGYPDGKGFPEVAYNYTAGANGQRRADYYQSVFKEILNVDIKLNPMDGAVFQAQLSDPKVKLAGMYTLGWCTDYAHPSDWLYLVFGSGGANGNGLNNAGYKSAEFDKVAKAADAELDPAKAAALYKQAHEILVNDVPVVWMFNTINVLLVKPNVKNLKPMSLDGGVPGSVDWENVDIQ